MRPLSSDFTLITKDHPEAERHPAWPPFLKAMEGHEYGSEALHDAWWWFKTGWQAFSDGTYVSWSGK